MTNKTKVTMIVYPENADGALPKLSELDSYQGKVYVRTMSNPLKLQEVGDLLYHMCEVEALYDGKAIISLITDCPFEHHLIAIFECKTLDENSDLVVQFPGEPLEKIDRENSEIKLYRYDSYFPLKEGA